ncbi:MAG: nitrogenase associated protein [Dehalococcoidia bacterium]|nr:nitrogenase associated protein [Chloroflexota bacterium]MCK4242986.1 nitrogenase associated protein [Dehalococcoidia bacterium]
MDGSRIAFKGTLQQLLEKVETGEMIPKMQASHAPMCKFMTAFLVLNGIRHCVPLVHAPTGCALLMSEWARRSACCERRGVPLEPVPCTTFDESDVIYGGEGKLLEAVQEADKKYHPDLIVILSCCTAGIIGDDVEMIAQEAEKLVNSRVLAIKSEGFGGDFRSGYEDAFKLIMELMEPPKKKQEKTINILGARVGPTATEISEDLKEIERLLGEVGIKINAEIAGGCTVEEIRRAREVELNASWCYDWGQKLGDLMKDRFGMPYSRTGLPYGLKATEEWLLGVARPLGMEKEALEVIKRETKKVLPELDCLERTLKGKTVIVEPTTVFNGPIRGLAMARMVEEFGAHPIVINIHPYTIKERVPSIKYLLETGLNPEVILTKGVFRLGSYSEMWQTEEELEKVVQGYDNAIYFGSSDRYPPCPVVNLGLVSRFPRYGFKGIQNIARLVETALKDTSRPRSKLFKEMIYG